MKKIILISLSMAMPALVLFLVSTLILPQWSKVSAATVQTTFQSSEILKIASSSDVVSDASSSSITSSNQKTVVTSALNTSTVPRSTSLQGNATGIYYVHVIPDSYFKLRGTAVIFSGSHFYPNETVTIKSNGIIIDSIVADSLGNFRTGSYTLPSSTTKVPFTFNGSISNIPYAVSITVGGANPWLILSSYYTGAGTPLTIEGHGFSANELLAVTYNNATIGLKRASENGEFTMTMIIPSQMPGKKIIRAEGTTGTSIEASFNQAF